MKRLTIISLFLLVNLLLSGQDIVVTTEVPSVVSVGEQFRVTWTVNSKGETWRPQNSMTSTCLWDRKHLTARALQ